MQFYTGVFKWITRMKFKTSPFVICIEEVVIRKVLSRYYNMTVWILAGYYISFTIAAGLIRLHMPGVKKSRV